MKYRDKSTIRYQINQQNREGEDKSERSKRRELERKYKKFNSKVYKYVDKDWWESVDDDVRKQLYRDWCYIVHDSFIYRGSASPKIMDPSDFENWIKIVRRDIKPNVVVYRNKILDRLLDE